MIASGPGTVMGDIGAIILAEVLKHNVALRDMDMSRVLLVFYLIAYI